MIGVDQHVVITIKQWKSSGIHEVIIDQYANYTGALIVAPGKGKIYYNGLQLTAKIIRVDKLYVDLVVVK
ncbi:hypothetical protein [Chrysodeixis includens nucleopolyhedrovirus]|uniref:Uncharacterized protein n=1 Tax=Chrysodeixis includens nucleopolyhedrovirus TaxID=1207438 RepID=A0A5B8YSW3_9ABAC|nr:hypothetical protein QKU06_gp024 [Chrysodeixis includens nucleopolyhedrovirus]QED40552.1 hypothetical protein [Chrysodeixis includens nucleopolyhedrovirus]